MVETDEDKKSEETNPESREKLTRNIWTIVNEAFLFHNMLAPLVYLSLLYGLITLFEFLGAKSEFTTSSFKVGLLISILGFLTTLVAFLDSNKRLKKIEEKMLKLKTDESNL